MAKTFEIGDHVSWNSAAGQIVLSDGYDQSYETACSGHAKAAGDG